MELSQLMLLRELAERGSITAVAQATARTPSAVSQQLRALQRAADQVLIVREGRGVRLTEAGDALARASVRLATAMAQTEAEWQSWLGSPTGAVSLSVFPSVGELLLPGLLARLRQWPGLELTLIDNDVAQPDFDALVNRADIVLAHRGEVEDVRASYRLHQVTLFGEPVDLAVPRGHRLALRARVSCAEVVDERWLGVPEAYPLDRLLEVVGQAAGRPVRVVWRSMDFGILAALVAAGEGVCLLPRYCTDTAARGLRLVPISDVTLVRRVEALARPDTAARGAVGAVFQALIDETARFRADQPPP